MVSQANIVHVVHSLQMGGLENGLVNLVNRLDHHRFRQIVCCLTTAGKFAERINHSAVDVIELNISESGFRLPLLRLATLFRKVRPDVVHTRGWPTVDAAFAARLAGVGHIVHGEHGREHSDPNGINWKRNQIRRAVGAFVDRYVIVCRFFREWLASACKVRDEKIVYIPNGVDTESFHPLNGALPAGSGTTVDTRERQKLRKRIGVPDVLLVGIVGRLDPVKDIATVMRAFQQLQPTVPPAKLVVVGDGPLRVELEGLAQRLRLESSVIWLGERRDIPEVLRCLDIFVQNSVFEGMSNTILEAMASGLPIVATATGGNPELVEPNQNGTLVPVGKSEDLAASLRQYLIDERLRLDHGSESRKRATEEFDLSLMVSRYAELYESLS